MTKKIIILLLLICFVFCFSFFAISEISNIKKKKNSIVRYQAQNTNIIENTTVPTLDKEKIKEESTTKEEILTQKNPQITEKVEDYAKDNVLILKKPPFIN